ncbi:MAG: hypothetical protein ACK2TV_11575 [Anaerolineales bacterium]
MDLLQEIIHESTLAPMSNPGNSTFVAPIIIGFPAIAPAPQKRKTATTLKLKI